MNRRDFLQHTLATGAVTALSASSVPALASRRRQVAGRLLQSAVDELDLRRRPEADQGGRLQTTGLLTRTKTEPFIGADATPEYLASLKQRIAASGLDGKHGCAAFTPRHPARRIDQGDAQAGRQRDRVWG